MPSFRVVPVVVTVAALLGALLSCGKDEQEAAKFERADTENFVRDMSDLSSFTLSNGVTVFLQEERTSDEVAVEVLYRAAFVNEPSGMPQLAHVTEHMALHCASGDFKAEESLELIGELHGMISAEAVADFSHVDYIITKENLESVIRVEAARLESLHCDEDVRIREIRKVKKELDNAIQDQRVTLFKYAMMSLNQVLFRGQRFVPINGIIDRISIDDVKKFHDTYYRPDDLVLVIIGNIKKPEAEALVRKYIEPIPRRPAPPERRVVNNHNVSATWDIAGECVFLVAPGPYRDFKERLILTILGTLVHQKFMTTQDVYSACRSVYASNQIYKVDVLPFFMFAEPGLGRHNSDVTPLLVQTMKQTLASIDDSRLEALKTGVINFQRSTMLKPDVSDYPMAHLKVIGQEALNVGTTYLAREGRSVDDYCAEVDAITLDDVQAVIEKYLDPARLIEITLTERE
jgi:zinc protease